MIRALCLSYPSASLALQYDGFVPVQYHVNRQFSRWRHLNTTTRIHFVLLSYLSLSPRWGLKNNGSDLRKKTTNWRILVVVIVQLFYYLKLQRAYCSSGFSHPLFSSVIFEVYWRVRELITKERKQVTRCGGANHFTTHPSLSYLRIIIRPSQCPSPLKLCCRLRKSRKKKPK